MVSTSLIGKPKMNINEELIRLSEDFYWIGIVTGSVSSLDERGESIVIISTPNMGSVNGFRKMSLRRSDFFKYYTTDGCYGFNLFKLKDEYKELAKKHKEALDVLCGSK